jgi:hypothetical protein
MMYWTPPVSPGPVHFMLPVFVLLTSIGITTAARRNLVQAHARC